MHHPARNVLPLLALLLTLHAPARAQTTRDADVFDLQRLHTVKLELSPASWKLLDPEHGRPRSRPPQPPSTQPYVEGQHLPPGPAGFMFAYGKTRLTFDGRSLDDAGLRFKGNVSYIISAAGPRRPFKLDVKRFVPGQHLAGLSTLNLNNSAFDPSELRETLAFALFRELLVPAPKTGWAAVYLTVPGTYEHEYLGRYTLIQEVDKRFLKEHFGNDQGLLCKPEGMRGLPYLGQDWAAYARLYNPKSGEDSPAAQRIIELARLINRANDADFARQIDQVLAVDEFLRYTAVNAAIVNLDSFLATGHNYYLYANPGDGRVHFIPWDMNLSFGGYSWVANAEDSANLSVMRPYTDHNRLIERLLAIPQYRQAYQAHMARLAELLDAGKMGPRIASYAPAFQAAARAAQAARKTGSPATRPSVGLKLHPPDLIPFLQARAQSIRLQLAGQRQGFVANYANPAQLPDNMARVAPMTLALIKCIDQDHDLRVSPEELEASLAALWLTAKVDPATALDHASAVAAIDLLLSPELRKLAPASAWADLLFRVTGAKKKQKLTREQVISTWRRYWSDRDHDTLVDIREAVDALAQVGTP